MKLQTLFCIWVNSNGQYDARSGTAVDVAVAISAKGKAATSGTFKLNAGIDSTGALAWNASAEAVAGALNALNGGSGAYGSKVSVEKLANGSYRVIFDDVGARVDMAGQSLDPCTRINSCSFNQCCWFASNPGAASH